MQAGVLSSMNITTVQVHPARGRDDIVFEIQFTDVKIIGNGSFGVVFKATLCSTNEQVAIKKVAVDNRFKSRELDFLRKLDHPNIIRLIYYFGTVTEKGENSKNYLNLIMEIMPLSLHQLLRQMSQNGTYVPSIFSKLYCFQLLRGLAFLHHDRIVHRDIKPQNLMINHDLGILKICDFGSCKKLKPGEANVAYICSRYYRAPELLLSATDYNTSIDLWSAGTVIAEFYNNSPIFVADCSLDLLLQMFKTLGLPSQNFMERFHLKFGALSLPTVIGEGVQKALKRKASAKSLYLICSLLRYGKNDRLHPIAALALPFFDALRNPDTKLPSGAALPPIFDWYEKEMTILPEFTRQVFPEQRKTVEIEDAS